MPVDNFLIYEEVYGLFGVRNNFSVPVFLSIGLIFFILSKIVYIGIHYFKHWLEVAI
jgi:hypothetical protein